MNRFLHHITRFCTGHYVFVTLGVKFKFTAGACSILYVTTVSIVRMGRFCSKFEGKHQQWITCWNNWVTLPFVLKKREGQTLFYSNNFWIAITWKLWGMLCLCTLRDYFVVSLHQCNLWFWILIVNSKFKNCKSLGGGDICFRLRKQWLPVVDVCFSIDNS